MKRVILLLVFATLLSSGIKASESVDTVKVDVRALLEKQIAEAREKMKNYSVNEEKPQVSVHKEESLQKNSESAMLKTASKDDEKEAELTAIANFLENTKKNIWTKLTKLPPFKRNLLPYFLMIEGVLLGTILAIWIMSRKFKSSNKKRKVAGLKTNIKKMREEKLIIEPDVKVSKIRKGLNAIALRIDDGGREIIKFAKEKGISKGEILLALKVKGLSRKYN